MKIRQLRTALPLAALTLMVGLTAVSHPASAQSRGGMCAAIFAGQGSGAAQQGGAVAAGSTRTATQTTAPTTARGPVQLGDSRVAAAIEFIRGKLDATPGEPPAEQAIRGILGEYEKALSGSQALTPNEVTAILRTIGGVRSQLATTDDALAALTKVTTETGVNTEEVIENCK